MLIWMWDFGIENNKINWFPFSLFNLFFTNTSPWIYSWPMGKQYSNHCEIIFLHKNPNLIHFMIYPTQTILFSLNLIKPMGCGRGMSLCPPLLIELIAQFSKSIQTLNFLILKWNNICQLNDNWVTSTLKATKLIL